MIYGILAIINQALYSRLLRGGEFNISRQNEGYVHFELIVK